METMTLKKEMSSAALLASNNFLAYVLNSDLKLISLNENSVIYLTIHQLIYHIESSNIIK